MSAADDALALANRAIRLGAVYASDFASQLVVAYGTAAAGIACEAMFEALEFNRGASVRCSIVDDQLGRCDLAAGHPGRYHNCGVYWWWA
jgi:hypothetical protein